MAIEELKQEQVSGESKKFMTEEEVRALIAEQTSNFTEVMRVKKSIRVGDKVLIDGANERYIVNDGTNDRVLIGKLAGKF